MVFNCPSCNKPIVVASSKDKDPSQPDPLLLPCGHLFCGSEECFDSLIKIERLKDIAKVGVKIYTVTCPLCNNVPYQVPVDQEKSLSDYLREGTAASSLKRALRVVRKAGEKEKHHAKKCKACKTQLSYCADCRVEFCPTCDSAEHAGHRAADLEKLMKDSEESIENCRRALRPAKKDSGTQYAATHTLYEDYSRCTAAVNEYFDALLAAVARQKEDALRRVTSDYSRHFHALSDGVAEHRSNIGCVLAADLALTSSRDMKHLRYIADWTATAESAVRTLNKRQFSELIRGIPTRTDVTFTPPLTDLSARLDSISVAFTTRKTNGFGLLFSIPVTQKPSQQGGGSGSTAIVGGGGVGGVGGGGGGGSGAPGSPRSNISSNNNSSNGNIGNSGGSGGGGGGGDNSGNKSTTINTYVPKGALQGRQQAADEDEDEEKGKKGKKDKPYPGTWREAVNGEEYTLSEDMRVVSVSRGTGEDGRKFIATVLGDTPIQENSEATFAFKINALPSSSGVMLGLSGNGYDWARQVNWKRSGWFLHTSFGMLFSCQPQNYAGKVYSTPRITRQGDVFYVTVNSAKHTMAFRLKAAGSDKVEDYGVAYEGIPFDEPVYPAAILSKGCSIELIK